MSASKDSLSDENGCTLNMNQNICQDLQSLESILVSMEKLSSEGLQELAKGDQFKTYPEAAAKIKAFCEKTFHPMKIIRSAVHDESSADFYYRYVCFLCVSISRFIPKSKGIGQTVKSRVRCKAVIKLQLCYEPFLHYQISFIDLRHNHKIGAEIYRQYPKTQSLTKEEKSLMQEIMLTNAKNSDIQLFVQTFMNKTITKSDLAKINLCLKKTVGDVLLNRKHVPYDKDYFVQRWHKIKELKDKHFLFTRQCDSSSHISQQNSSNINVESCHPTNSYGDTLGKSIVIDSSPLLGLGSEVGNDSGNKDLMLTSQNDEDNTTQSCNSFTDEPFLPSESCEVILDTGSSSEHEVDTSESQVQEQADLSPQRYATVRCVTDKLAEVVCLAEGLEFEQRLKKLAYLVKAWENNKEVVMYKKRCKYHMEYRNEKPFRIEERSKYSYNVIEPQNEIQKRKGTGLNFSDLTFDTSQEESLGDPKAFYGDNSLDVVESNNGCGASETVDVSDSACKIVLDEGNIFKSKPPQVQTETNKWMFNGCLMDVQNDSDERHFFLSDYNAYENSAASNSNQNTVPRMKEKAKLSCKTDKVLQRNFKKSVEKFAKITTPFKKICPAPSFKSNHTLNKTSDDSTVWILPNSRSSCASFNAVPSVGVNTILVPSSAKSQTIPPYVVPVSLTNNKSSTPTILLSQASTSMDLRMPVATSTPVSVPTNALSLSLPVQSNVLRGKNHVSDPENFAPSCILPASMTKTSILPQANLVASSLPQVVNAACPVKQNQLYEDTIVPNQVSTSPIILKIVPQIMSESHKSIKKDKSNDFLNNSASLQAFASRRGKIKSKKVKTKRGTRIEQAKSESQSSVDEGESNSLSSVSDLIHIHTYAAEQNCLNSGIAKGKSGTNMKCSCCKCSSSSHVPDSCHQKKIDEATPLLGLFNPQKSSSLSSASNVINAIATGSQSVALKVPQAPILYSLLEDSTEKVDQVLAKVNTSEVTMLKKSMVTGTKQNKVLKHQRKIINPGNIAVELNIDKLKREFTFHDIKDLMSGDMLSVKVMNMAQALIKAKFPHAQGLQDVQFGPSLSFEVLENEFVQIIQCVSIPHWITVSTLNNPPATAHVYSSMNEPVPRCAVPQICNIMNVQSSELTIISQPMQLQLNNSDCGLFALAAAITLLSGKDPSKTIYDHKAMREYLLSGLLVGRLQEFPVQKKGLLVLSERRIERFMLHCVCRQPMLENSVFHALNDWFECDKCKKKYHKLCKVTCCGDLQEL